VSVDVLLLAIIWVGAFVIAPLALLRDDHSLPRAVAVDTLSARTP